MNVPFRPAAVLSRSVAVFGRRLVPVILVSAVARIPGYLGLWMNADMTAPAVGLLDGRCWRWGSSPACWAAPW